MYFNSNEGLLEEEIPKFTNSCSSYIIFCFLAQKKMRKRTKTHPGWFIPIMQSSLSYIFTITTQASISLPTPKFTLFSLPMMQIHLVRMSLLRISKFITKFT